MFVCIDHLYTEHTGSSLSEVDIRAFVCSDVLPVLHGVQMARGSLRQFRYISIFTHTMIKFVCVIFLHCLCDTETLLKVMYLNLSSHSLCRYALTNYMHCQYVFSSL